MLPTYLPDMVIPTLPPPLTIIIALAIVVMVMPCRDVGRHSVPFRSSLRRSSLPVAKSSLLFFRRSFSANSPLLSRRFGGAAWPSTSSPALPPRGGGCLLVAFRCFRRAILPSPSLPFLPPTTAVSSSGDSSNAAGEITAWRGLREGSCRGGGEAMRNSEWTLFYYIYSCNRFIFGSI